jgi:L-lactate dehydrogenase complex protein LldE
MTLADRDREDAVADQRDHAAHTCTACGTCFRTCPAVEQLDFADLTPKEVQAQVRAYLGGGDPTEVVFRRAFSCVGCYGCCEGTCPQGLDVMRVNEIVKALYRRGGLEATTYTPSRDPQAPQRVLASIKATPEDYRRIFTPSPPGLAGTVFFPGCNVYAQPARLLEALDVLALIGEEVAFLPGLDHCCGDTPFFMGDPDEGVRAADDLVAALSAYEPETVVLWCPTCLCRMNTDSLARDRLPFRTLSLAQFLTERADRLRLSEPVSMRATLHEACKAAFTGLDLEGPRRLLGDVGGLELVEMPRSHAETVCCGSGAFTWFPEIGATLRDARLEEARQTGADLLIDVCHYCHHVFLSDARRFDIVPEYWIHVLARAAGVARDDDYATWRASGDAERICTLAANAIAASPFDRETIATVLRSHFSPTPQMQGEQ